MRPARLRITLKSRKVESPVAPRISAADRGGADNEVLRRKRRLPKCDDLFFVSPFGMPADGDVAQDHQGKESHSSAPQESVLHSPRRKTKEQLEAERSIKQLTSEIVRMMSGPAAKKLFLGA